MLKKHITKIVVIIVGTVFTVSFVGSVSLLFSENNEIGKINYDTSLSSDFMEVPTSYEIIGFSNKHYFENIETGEKISVEVSDEDYDFLLIKNAKQPQKEGYKWLYSVGKEPIFSKEKTKSLNDFEYMVISSTTIKVKIPKYKEKLLDNEYMVDKRLSKDGLKIITNNE